MRRGLSVFIVCFLLLGSFPSPVYGAIGNRHTRNRTIHLVYDDSGSMLSKGSTSWCQAKYAMEVFAAMMGTDDSLKIYPMSSFSYKGSSRDKSDSWGKTIQISGKESPSDRIKKIDQMNGDNGSYRNTPISAVTTAGDELIAEDTSDKWLVILTDGAFDDGSDGNWVDNGPPYENTKSAIRQYVGNDGINVAYVAIGSNAVELGLDEEEHFFGYHADTNNILDTVTSVARVVFNYQAIPVSGSGTYSFSTDIPVSRIIAFGQGSAVEVGEIMHDGVSIGKSSAAVDVQVTKDTPYIPKTHSQVAFADGLKGKVVTYEASDEKKPFPDGAYSFQSNASNIEVYFEPGVDIQVILEGPAGETINIHDGNVSSIDAGQWTVRIKIVNPLTGEEIIPSDSSLLNGAKYEVSFTDDDGETVTCQENDEVTIQEGKVTVVAKARFKGDIEKTTAEKTVKVTKSPLVVNFSEPKGYAIDPISLQTKKDVIVRVSGKDKEPFTTEEYASLEMDVTGPDGIAWEYTKTAKEGEYELVPSYTNSQDYTSVDFSQKVNVSVRVNHRGVPMTGTASTTLIPSSENSLELSLHLQMPPERDFGDGKPYMFDCKTRDIQPDAPFILVTAEIDLGNGTRRPLTKDEWDAGEKTIKISSKAIDQNILWKLINHSCTQSLDFTAVKGEKISTYKLYLAGLTETGVRPGRSEITVKMNTKLSNGIRAEGEAVDAVTVRPLGVLRYIGRILVTLLGILLVLIFAIMEIRKKRFDKDMKPQLSGTLRRYGTPIKEDIVRAPKKRRYWFLPPWKPQEMDISLRFHGYIRQLTLHCVADGGGTFIIKNLNDLKIKYGDSVRVDGMTPSVFTKTTVKLNLNSTIKIRVAAGSVEGSVYVRFQ